MTTYEIHLTGPVSHQGPTARPVHGEPAMTTYEIHLTGELSPSRAAQLGLMAHLEVTAQTVLVTNPLDPVGLHDLLGRLTDFGIELVELRRAASGHAEVGLGE